VYSYNFSEDRKHIKLLGTQNVFALPSLRASNGSYSAHCIFARDFTNGTHGGRYLLLVHLWLWRYETPHFSVCIPLRRTDYRICGILIRRGFPRLSHLGVELREYSAVWVVLLAHLSGAWFPWLSVPRKQLFSALLCSSPLLTQQQHSLAVSMQVAQATCVIYGLTVAGIYPRKFCQWQNAQIYCDGTTESPRISYKIYLANDGLI